MGKHLAFQCHIEMTPEMVQSWCDIGLDEIRDSTDSPGVQLPAEIQQDLVLRVAALQDVARRVYEKWVAGLKQ